MNKIIELEKLASQVRRDIIRMVSDVNSGHPGGSLGAADFMVALYFDALNCNPEKFEISGKGEDMFFLSNGHISPLWYSVLARKGYFAVSELSTFRRLHTRLQGHPTTAEGLPGVRIASGSLGQGLSAAIGAALGKKLDNENNLVFSLHGDGELQEGQIWEAAIFAAAKKVDNLIATVDYNGQQIDGPLEKVISMGNLKAKWEAFGWLVLESPGNDMKAVVEVIQKAKESTGQGKPVVILLKTEMGFGVDFMQGTHHWHGKAPNAEQTKTALAQLTETHGDY
jgi:transketolase